MLDPAFSESMLDDLYLGEPAAVEAWFYAYTDALYTFIYYRVSANPDLAADILHETFLAALEDIQLFDPSRTSMLAWLTTVSRSIIRKHVRDRSTFHPNFPVLTADLLLLYGQIASQPLPPELIEQKETADLVRATLTTIPQNFSRVLYDHAFRRMDLRTVARLYGISESSARALLQKACAAFKDTFLKLAASLYVPSSKEGGTNG